MLSPRLRFGTNGLPQAVSSDSISGCYTLPIAEEEKKGCLISVPMGPLQLPLANTSYLQFVGF